jgi:ectoine hydroxylase-related dioxygenase (phytanoyl-CoA dioxygenase family)
MSEVDTVEVVRRAPLTDAELATYRERGYLIPGRLLSSDQVEQLRQAIQEHLDGKFEGTVTYDFADPTLDLTKGARMVKPLSAKEQVKRREQAERTLPLLFNLWEIDDRFREVALNPVAAGWAAQLLEADEVLLFEDTAFVKPAHKGGLLPWHQDYSAYPTATADIVGFWMALDDVDVDNGTLRYAAGSHKLGEVLPVGPTGEAFMQAERPGVREMGDPEAMGMDIEDLILKKGECVLAHALTWHASGPNNSDRPRRAYAVRYMTAGTIWLGEKRYPYRPDREMDFPVPSPVIVSARFPRVERAF